jgi:hypothetical protein
LWSRVNAAVEPSKSADATLTVVSLVVVVNY